VSHFDYYHAECHYAESLYAECHYAKCRSAECRYAECRGAGGSGWQHKACSIIFTAVKSFKLPARGLN
jgi:hypothetical protein